MTSLKNGQNGQTCVWIIIIVIVIVVLIAIIVFSINLSLSLFLFLGVQTSNLLCSCCRAASTLMLRPFFLPLLRALLGGQLLLTRLTPTPHTPHSTSVSRLEVLEMIFPVAGESSLVYGNCCWKNFKLRGVRTAPTAVLCSTWCCPLLLPLLMLPAAFTRNFPSRVIRGNATVAAFPKCNLQSVRAVWPIIAANATKQ